MKSFKQFYISESRSENLKQLASIEVPYRVDDRGEYYKTKDGYRHEYNSEIFGTQIEYLDNNGRRSRLDGPAIIKPDGSKAWFFNGKLHRIDGPAIEKANGDKEWYINGVPMSEQDFDKWRAKNNPIKESRADNLKQLALMEVPFKVDVVGNEYYKTKEGYRVEDTGGNILWYDKKGRHHRTDGPASVYANGHKEWYVNGKKHRLDGPASEYADGEKHWYVKGKYHRLDGPAVEYADGSKFWYVNGNLHRTDGPASEYADGTKRWYINDKKMTEEQFNEWRAKHNPIK